MRQTLDFNADWHFSRDVKFDTAVTWSPQEHDLLGFEPISGDWDGVTWSKAGKCFGPAGEDFDHREWQAVRLPHDWCVQSRPAPDAPIRNGFLPMGVGWYRKTFDVPSEWESRRVALAFEGVFRCSSVFVNGHLVAQNESGYIGFEAAIDAVLRYGEPNTIAVRVDSRAKEGWFYEGCGIYRPVRLMVTDPLYLASDGVFVKPDLVVGAQPAAAELRIQAQVVNDTDSVQAFAIVHRVLSPKGVCLAEVRQDGQLAAGTSDSFLLHVELSKPKLWSIDDPTLYRLETAVVNDGLTVDQMIHTFGVRQAEFDANRGFLLNGQPVKLKGVCCHQDHAGVGSAIPGSLQVWRLEQLKQMGVNAYRTSHHPPSREVLAACDRLGIVVIDEARVFGISAEHLSQASRMVRRDRNHPCVILWSLANEEMHVQCSTQGARMFATVKRHLKAIDDSRPFTSAINNGWDHPIGFIEHEDVHGLNYFNQGSLDKLRRIAPQMPVLVSEASSAVSTRGIYQDDPALGHVTSYDRHRSPDHPGVRMWPFWGREAEASWKVVASRSDLAGTFVWTGFDYRGEQSPFVRWPCVGSHFGIMDQCGYPKDVYWYYKAWWGDEPVLHIMPHWDGPGQEDADVQVWVYTNAKQVRLELNGRDLGTQSVPAQGHLSWKVAWEPGRLRAIGRWQDGSESEAARVTSGRPTAVRLERLRPSLPLFSDPTAIIRAAVVDANGRTVPTARHPMRFELIGNGCILGMGNGDPNDHTPGRPLDSVAELAAFGGLAQAILSIDQTVTDPRVELVVSSPGLESDRIVCRPDWFSGSCGPQVSSGAPENEEAELEQCVGSTIV